jgi:hypothetical protein
MTGSVLEVEFVPLFGRGRLRVPGRTSSGARPGTYAEIAHPPGLVCETLHERSAVPQHFVIELVDALDRDAYAK